MPCAVLNNPGYPPVPLYLEGIYWAERDGCTVWRSFKSRSIKTGDNHCRVCKASDRKDRTGPKIPLVTFKVLDSVKHSYPNIFHTACLDSLQEIDKRAYLLAAIKSCSSSGLYNFADGSKLKIVGKTWNKSYDDMMDQPSKYLCRFCNQEFPSALISIEKCSNRAYNGSYEFCLSCIPKHPFLRYVLHPDNFERLTDTFDMTNHQQNRLRHLAEGCLKAGARIYVPPEQRDFPARHYAPCRVHPEPIEMHGKTVYRAKSPDECMADLQREILEECFNSRAMREWLNTVRNAPPISKERNIDLDKLFPSYWSSRPPFDAV